MSWDTDFLEKYEIFEGIKGNNLSTLLDCISAKIHYIEEGQVALQGEEAEKKVALILDGEVLARDGTDKEVTLQQGELFGKDFPGEIKVSRPSRILTFNHREVYAPCWFSCFFHGGFIDNVDKAARKNSE